MRIISKLSLSARKPPLVWITISGVLAAREFSAACCLLMAITVKSWWCHQMEAFFRVTGPLGGEFNSLHKTQWRRVLILSLISTWINDWVNNHEAGDLRGHLAHYDITVMIQSPWQRLLQQVEHRTPWFPKVTDDVKIAMVTRQSESILSLSIALNICMLANARFLHPLVVNSASRWITIGFIAHVDHAQNKLSR